MRRAAAVFTSSHPPRLDSGPAGDPVEGWGPYCRGGADRRLVSRSPCIRCCEGMASRQRSDASANVHRESLDQLVLVRIPGGPAPS